MIGEGTDEAKLTFGDLKEGEFFIYFPCPGDNEGHGGYLGAHNLFRKTEQKATGELVPINSGSGVNGRGVVSHFPHTMTVLKIRMGAFGQ
jgi:hypothetical protein